MTILKDKNFLKLLPLLVGAAIFFAVYIPYDQGYRVINVKNTGKEIERRVATDSVIRWQLYETKEGGATKMLDAGATAMVKVKGPNIDQSLFYAVHSLRDMLEGRLRLLEKQMDQQFNMILALLIAIVVGYIVSFFTTGPKKSPG